MNLVEVGTTTAKAERRQVSAKTLKELLYRNLRVELVGVIKGITLRQIPRGLTGTHLAFVASH